MKKVYSIYIHTIDSTANNYFVSPNKTKQENYFSAIFKYEKKLLVYKSRHNLKELITGYKIPMIYVNRNFKFNLRINFATSLLDTDEGSFYSDGVIPLFDSLLENYIANEDEIKEYIKEYENIENYIDKYDENINFIDKKKAYKEKLEELFDYANKEYDKVLKKKRL